MFYFPLSDSASRRSLHAVEDAKAVFRLLKDELGEPEEAKGAKEPKAPLQLRLRRRKPRRQPKANLGWCSHCPDSMVSLCDTRRNQSGRVQRTLFTLWKVFRRDCCSNSHRYEIGVKGNHLPVSKVFPCLRKVTNALSLHPPPPPLPLSTPPPPTLPPPPPPPLPGVRTRRTTRLRWPKDFVSTLATVLK